MATATKDTADKTGEPAAASEPTEAAMPSSPAWADPTHRADIADDCPRRDGPHSFVPREDGVAHCVFCGHKA